MEPESINKFALHDLTDLRNELLQAGLDSWQAAELVSTFIAGRGYGVSSGDARTAVTRMEFRNCSLECMKAEMEHLALPM